MQKSDRSVSGYADGGGSAEQYVGSDVPGSALQRVQKDLWGGIAAQVGLTVKEIDEIYETEGRDGFLQIIRDAAEKHAVKPADFVRHLDEVGIEWGITCDGDHDNRKTAELVQAFPKKFKGFIYVDPNKGEEGCPRA